MTLEEFARLVLFGTSMDEKLISVNLAETEQDQGAPSSSPIEIPSFPGRPSFLAQPGKANFPSLAKIHEPYVRGEILHFFANHELLAMELMALLLLRFPESPFSFRMGIARIIQEEQNHLRLYISRMEELGVKLGDLPVSDYFWNTMKKIQSPLDFVTQMSLTFEQANLDFSYFFMNEVKKAGDDATAAILERVFREEIGHVKHGLVWFNRWRPNSSTLSDWDSYVQLLPSPMTPRRAKGFGFCEEARQQAGLSDTFIRELKLYSGSKGRPPLLWLYNPHCESEIVRGKAGFTPTGGARRITEDLELTPLFLASAHDSLLIQKRPTPEWLESLQKAGFEIPELIEYQGADYIKFVRAPKLGGLEPWGWSPDLFQSFQPFLPQLVEVSGGNAAWCKRILSSSHFHSTGIGKLYSKSWSVEFLHSWLEAHAESISFFGPPTFVGQILKDFPTVKARIQEILLETSFAMVKAPYGTSGMQVKKVGKLEELEGPLGGWIRKVLAQQGEIIVEHGLNKVCDLSSQMEVRSDRIELLGVRKFIIGSAQDYRGTYLGAKLRCLEPDQLRFLHSAMPLWQKMLRDLGAALRQEGYEGPAGVDALLWKNAQGELQLKPLVELNPRWTMGRVALQLEKRLAPGVDGIWSWIPMKKIRELGYPDALSLAQDLHQRYPLQLTPPSERGRMERGFVFTNDPSRAQEVLTCLSTLSDWEDALKA